MGGHTSTNEWDLSAEHFERGWGHDLWCCLRTQFCVDDVVVVELAGVWVVPVAGDEAQFGSFGVPVHGLSGEGVFGVLLAARENENGRGAVLAGDLDSVSRFKFAQVCEDPWSAIGCVDVSEKDRWPAFSGGGGLVVPTRGGTWVSWGYLKGSVVLQAKTEQF